MKRLKIRVFAMAAAACVLVLGPVSESRADVDQVKQALVSSIDGNELLNEAAKTYVKEQLLPQCTNSTFVDETTSQNKQGTSLDEIKKIDAEWQAAEEPLPIQEEKLTNSTATEVRKFADAQKAVVEAFVMDNQGAVVGENLLTSDYWQGDEAKWTNSYADGKGGVDVGKPKFDKSANANLQQVSLPIINADGKVIGAVTYGINLDNL